MGNLKNTDIHIMNSSQVFISYSHKDSVYKDLLVKHLKVLQEENILSVWDDSLIFGGEKFEKKIIKALDSSRVAILLLSADFLTSRFIRDKELSKIFEVKKEDKNFIIYPIILRPCSFKHVNWLCELNIRPKDASPLSTMQDHEKELAITSIVEEITSILNIPLDEDYDILNKEQLSNILLYKIPYAESEYDTEHLLELLRNETKTFYDIDVQTQKEKISKREDMCAVVPKGELISKDGYRFSENSKIKKIQQIIINEIKEPFDEFDVDVFLKNEIFIDKQIDKIVTLSILGELFYTKNRITTALKYFKDLLDYSEEIHSANAESYVHGWYGIIYGSGAKINIAISHYEKALKIRESLKDFQGVSNILHNIGICQQAYGNLSTAILYHKRALSHNQNKPTKQIRDYLSIGVCCNYTEDSLINFNKALQLANDNHKTKEQARISFNIGIASFKLGKMQKSINAFKEAQEYFRSIKDSFEFKRLNTKIIPSIEKMK